ncbi:MAG: hypothetical protein HYV09_40595 [Deltaproteobacteria bacterium]|nr:hypothetical protein [Deltaproteobacteria bacterium]
MADTPRTQKEIDAEFERRVERRIEIIRIRFGDRALLVRSRAMDDVLRNRDIKDLTVDETRAKAWQALERSRGREISLFDAYREVTTGRLHVITEV